MARRRRSRSAGITEAGASLEYDALLLALGAVLRPRFSHALTLDDSLIDEQLHGLIQDVEGGYVRKLAFIAPTPMPWPLPIYELALMTARRAYDMNVDLSITLATPEDAPLAVLGSENVEPGGRATARGERHSVHTLCALRDSRPRRGLDRAEVVESLHVDRVVALPQLFGPSTPGVPLKADNGFIPIDAHCGSQDWTGFMPPESGRFRRQARRDRVAASRYCGRGDRRLAGAPIEPQQCQPVIHGMLVGGRKPLYLTAHITGGHGSSSEVSETPNSSPAAKITAKYLAPYLESLDRAALR